MSLVDNGSPWECRGQWRESWSIDDDDDDDDDDGVDDDDDDEVMLH